MLYIYIYPVGWTKYKWSFSIIINLRECFPSYDGDDYYMFWCCWKINKHFAVGAGTLWCSWTPGKFKIWNHRPLDQLPERKSPIRSMWWARSFKSVQTDQPAVCWQCCYSLWIWSARDARNEILDAERWTTWQRRARQMMIIWNVFDAVRRSTSSLLSVLLLYYDVVGHQANAKIWIEIIDLGQTRLDGQR